VFCFLVSLWLLPCKPLESDTWKSNSALHIALQDCVSCVVHELSWMCAVWSIHRYALKNTVLGISFRFVSVYCKWKHIVWKITALVIH
jgi:hypothetical protein